MKHHLHEKNQEIEWINEDDILNNNFAKIIIAEPPEKQYRLICDMSLAGLHQAPQLL